MTDRTAARRLRPAQHADDRFWTRWITRANGDTLVLCCRLGYTNKALLVRDVPGKKHDLARRVNELNMMLRNDFADAIDAAGFRPASPAAFAARELSRAA